MIYSLQVTTLETTLTTMVVVSFFLLIFTIGASIRNTIMQKEMIKIAYRDIVTGIDNMQAFKLKTNQILSKSKDKYYYIVLDIKQLKIINELFGYAVGDSLLKYLAGIISNEINSIKEAVGRIHSDEFHILMKYSEDNSLEKRLKKIMDAVNSFVFSDNMTYNIEINTGVYLIEDNAENYERISDKATIALEKNKDKYDCGISYYNDVVRSLIIQEKEITNDMQKAVENKEFVVYLQPKINVDTGELYGAEALARWQHPTRGFTPPNKFIPIFEKTGFTPMLDMYILEEVCRMIKQWKEKGITDIVVSVNQSRLHLYNDNYVEDVCDVLKRYSVDPKFIELEITESLFYDNTERLISIIDQLHSKGFSISMDDFGAGYSSLNMLKKIDVNVLKIDKEFFSATVLQERDKKILESIIHMTNNLGIKVVAEGVEREAQVDFLRAAGCRIIQGFYFSKPLPIETFESKFLQKI